MRLLFETQHAASEVAFMIGCDYDGCNMITLPPVYDTIALRTAIELAGVEFCFDGDHYPIVLPLSAQEINFNDPEQQSGQNTSQSQLWHSCESPF